MRDLCRRFLEEESAGAGSLEELSEALRTEIEKRVAPEIIAQGFAAIKSFLKAF